MKKIAFITGASSGIGEATAISFAAAGYQLILCARRKDRLEKIKSELFTKYKTDIFILTFDVQNNNQVQKAIDSLPENWKKINVLINNAGLSLGLSSIEDGDTDDWETMIDTNVKGLLWVTKALIPLLKKSLNPQIINIGSIAGKQTYVMGNVYCASKHAVAALSDAMRIDLLSAEIKVTAIHPGAVETEFSVVRFKGDQTKANQVYQGFKPLMAADVADSILYCAGLPPHVNINELTIMPLAQASPMYLNKTR